MLTTCEKNILVKDSDGNWYSIPPAMEKEFIVLKEQSINSEFGSHEWHCARDEIQSVFGDYIK